MELFPNLEQMCVQVRLPAGVERQGSNLQRNLSIYTPRSGLSSLVPSRPVPACRHIPLRGDAISALSKLPPPRPEDRLLLIADEEAPKELLAAEGRVFHSFKI